MIGVLMAAGMGQRLGGATTKALVEIDGRPLCHYAFDFLRDAGANRLIVVGGYRFEDLKPKVEEYGKDILILENKDYKKGNLFTLLQALPHIDDSFLLCNTDHIYKKGIAEKIREQFKGVTAFCDFDRPLGDDDMKVWHDDYKLKHISKKLTQWNGGYVGLTYCGKEILPQYKSIIDGIISRGEDNVVAEDVLRHLASGAGNVHIGDISGVGWLEVDFPEELARAKDAIAKERHMYY
jgi:choline kinase